MEMGIICQPSMQSVGVAQHASDIHTCLTEICWEADVAPSRIGSPCCNGIALKVQKVDVKMTQHDG